MNKFSFYSTVFTEINLSFTVTQQKLHIVARYLLEMFLLFCFLLGTNSFDHSQTIKKNERIV